MKDHTREFFNTLTYIIAIVGVALISLFWIVIIVFCSDPGSFTDALENVDQLMFIYNGVFIPMLGILSTVHLITTWAVLILVSFYRKKHRLWGQIYYYYGLIIYAGIPIILIMILAFPVVGWLILIMLPHIVCGSIMLASEYSDRKALASQKPTPTPSNLN
ncbi:MAG: hypothetical protein LBC33_00710 [Mycoplasmataceae bacterium]|jgi:hypothetical protein|nr:hypothetical protein [Mycoplasmataceae bacterium]